MPLIPKVRGFRFQVRISDLGPADVVEMVCGQCRRTYMVAPYQLHLRFVPQTLLETVGERFHCKACGWRGKPKSAARWSVYSAQTAVTEHFR